jgi:predicted dehydrogenase
VAVSDPDAAARAHLARNPLLANTRFYGGHRELLDHEKIDIAAICNTNGERAALILECLARKLHVVAEKPLAIERADLEKIKQLTAKSGVRLSMLLPMRFDPVYLALKQIVDSGEIGEVALIDAQKSYKGGSRAPWYTKRSTYGGTIPWIGIHMVDLMRWTSGREFTDAMSFQTHIAYPELGDMENVTATLFRMDNGGAATLRMDYLRPESCPTHGDDRLRLAGTKGIAEYMAATGVTVLSAGRKPRVVTQLPPRRWLFAEFLESVYNGKPESLTLADIYRVNDIVLAAREAAEKRQIMSL